MFQIAIIDSATRHPIHFTYVRPLYFAFGYYTTLLTYTPCLEKRTNFVTV